jgi:transketolase
MATGTITNTNPNLPVKELEKMAMKIRRHIITMLGEAGSGHPGGSLSAADIVTCLYFNVLRHNPAYPDWPDRDRFILSKGHAAPVLYSALAERGYFPVEELSTLRKLGSSLQGHCEKGTTIGVDMTAGSLGQGLSFSIGAACAARLDKKDYRIYTMLGDGECDEGQVWEAAMAAAHFKVDNLTAILDNNGLQIDGWNKDVMNLEPIHDKWKAFGWNVIEINGHDIPQILKAFKEAQSVKGKPSIILAHTIKGKGVSFMENQAGFHGKAPTAEQVEKALKELV